MILKIIVFICKIITLNIYEKKTDDLQQFKGFFILDLYNLAIITSYQIYQ